MSAVAPAPRSPSGRGQTPAYHSTADRDHPHRTQSMSARQTSTSSPRRSLSVTHPTQPTPSATRTRPLSTNLDRVARHDVEQANVAQTTQRSEPQEPQMDAPPEYAPRGDTGRSGAGHGRTQSRYTDQPVPAPDSHAASRDTDTKQPPNPQQQHLRRRTTIDAQTGHWELGKTIGAGSMGKVKLARNRETGEQVAVKIVPRQSADNEHRSPQERERADHSKEIRTAREAAIVTLADHPYICGMRDVVRTNYHWYMLFEYVNGGQMLDYIISHGRLKEKQARKFGRQIASALDYCHRNNIVHRDLKIENILISKTGDIKIIDFGLSNLFAPKGHLKTFCGSLYFAAPELLQARQYTGPEVDVWSFGIVLYVLVCGKVPFDDQSMPQLHAKIKKGSVEYPPWLTVECRSLIARMLMTNPSERATLQEIMNHPWMTKGFSGPPENHLPNRKPLKQPLDQGVIEKMTGFDFGEPEVITAQLNKIIESEDYQRVVRLQEKRSTQLIPDAEQKRGVFNFYKRRSSINSRDTLNPPSSEAVQFGSDPLNAFHPLISVYYLAMEKQEREAREKNPGGLHLPRTSGEKPLQMSDLAPPEAAHTNTQTYEMAGEKPTGGRSRPRARTHGEDDVTDGVQNINVNASPSPMNPAIVEPTIDPRPPGHSRKESTAAGLLRRLSTRKHKDPAERERDRERGERPHHPPSSLAAYSPSDSPAKSLSVRRVRDGSSSRTREAAGAGADTAASTAYQSESPAPPLRDVSNERVKRSAGGLARSISVNSGDMRRRLARRGVSDGSSLRPPGSSPAENDSKRSFDQAGSIKEAASDVESSRPGSGRATRTRSVNHGRRESTQVRRARRDFPNTYDVPEETDREMMDEMDGNNNDSGNSTGMKPVYLKGLFSVSTTSNKPLSFIRSDIIRVLRQLGVEYKEIRGGFSCIHRPSIVASPPGEHTTPSSGVQSLQPPTDYKAHGRKFSFGGNRREKLHYANSEEESDEDPPTSHPRPAASRALGETSTQVQADVGSNMVLKLEIFVVKVPLLSLHGIQFKKVDGGTWPYKNMAQKILNELRL